MEKLPAPRLQLRWEPYEGESHFGANWACHYELVMPLGEFDIRREIYNDDGEQIADREELVVSFKGPTLRGATTVPCYGNSGELHADAPYRDGAHANWDAAALGGLPIFVVAPDGKSIRLGPKSDD